MEQESSLKRMSDVGSMMHQSQNRATSNSTSKKHFIFQPISSKAIIKTLTSIAFEHDKWVTLTLHAKDLMKYFNLETYLHSPKPSNNYLPIFLLHFLFSFTNFQC